MGSTPRVPACSLNGVGMAELVFADSYFETVGDITSPRLQDRLLDLLSLMQDVPTFGSRNVRGSLRDRFGDNCMTADLSPFLLVFEYAPDDDVVYVYGVVHQRAVI